MMEWQPIETAPKDGTRVLLWVVPPRIWMPFEWRGGRWMGDDYPLNMAEATHWTPLPPQPDAPPLSPTPVDASPAPDTDPKVAALVDAAKAVVNRWDGPSWGGNISNIEHTADVINRLRTALAAWEGRGNE